MALVGCSGAENGQAPETAGNVGEVQAAHESVDGHHDPARLFQHFDKNADGTLEVAELPPRMQRWLVKADGDGDGRLTVAELTAHAAAHRHERFARKFERMDRDGDGVVTHAEVGDEKWSRIAPADVNADGTVTKAELDQARAARPAPR